MQTRPWRVRLKVIVSAAVYALIAAAVLGMAWINPVVHEGNSHDFWKAACGVCLDGDYERRGRFEAFPARDGWLVYQPVDYIDSIPPLYRIREEVAFADFPEVVKHLDRPERLEWDRGLDLSRWREADPEVTNPTLFLREVRIQRLAQRKRLGNGSDQRQLAREKAIDDCWWRAGNWRPVQVAAELVYFAALASWLLFPWWRSASWPWYVVHLVWLPWLVLAPYWLGYSAGSFSTFADPEEGVLYPVVSLTPSLSSVEPEDDLWRNLPRPLASLPGQVGQAGLRWFPIHRGHGPLAAMAWSVLLCAPLLIIRLLLAVAAALERHRRAIQRRDVRSASYRWLHFGPDDE